MDFFLTYKKCFVDFFIIISLKSLSDGRLTLIIYIYLAKGRVGVLQPYLNL